MWWQKGGGPYQSWDSKRVPIPFFFWFQAIRVWPVWILRRLTWNHFISFGRCVLPELCWLDTGLGVVCAEKDALVLCQLQLHIYIFYILYIYIYILCILYIYTYIKIIQNLFMPIMYHVSCWMTAKCNHAIQRTLAAARLIGSHLQRSPQHPCCPPPHKG